MGVGGLLLVALITTGILHTTSVENHDCIQLMLMLYQINCTGVEWAWSKNDFLRYNVIFFLCTSLERDICGWFLPPPPPPPQPPISEPSWNTPCFKSFVIPLALLSTHSQILFF